MSVGFIQFLCYRPYCFNDFAACALTVRLTSQVAQILRLSYRFEKSFLLESYWMLQGSVMNVWRK
jgi:hypothetical protein